MTRGIGLLVGALTLLFAGSASAQFPILDVVAEKIVQKYNQSTCEQLWAQKSEPKSPREQEMVQMMRNNPEMRTAFIDKVAAPIVNKMFECGMVP